MVLVLGPNTRMPKRRAVSSAAPASRMSIVARSSSVVAGVMRSTIVEGNATSLAM